jgi:hypothetical protein
VIARANAPLTLQQAATALMAATCWAGQYLDTDGNLAERLGDRLRLCIRQSDGSHRRVLVDIPKEVPWLSYTDWEDDSERTG